MNAIKEAIVYLKNGTQKHGYLLDFYPETTNEISVVKFFGRASKDLVKAAIDAAQIETLSFDQINGIDFYLK